MKLGAYQSRLTYDCPSETVAVLRPQIDRCETLGVDILCCAECVLGGLADYANDADAIALGVANRELASVLAPLASDQLTTILGFTERGDDGALYNSAAVWSRGRVLGVYRKRHPAIRRSAYQAGRDYPIFTVGALTFGILICRDSLFPDIAQTLVAAGARALFVPTNNGMPAPRGGEQLVLDARRVDTACAIANSVPIIRADVVGRCGELQSSGATGIVNGNGDVRGVPFPGREEFVVVELDVQGTGVMPCLPQ